MVNLLFCYSAILLDQVVRTEQCQDELLCELKGKVTPFDACSKPEVHLSDFLYHLSEWAHLEPSLSIVALMYTGRFLKAGYVF